jgi:hypothetical protein
MRYGCRATRRGWRIFASAFDVESRQRSAIHRSAAISPRISHMSGSADRQLLLVAPGAEAAIYTFITQRSAIGPNYTANDRF